MNARTQETIEFRLYVELMVRAGLLGDSTCGVSGGIYYMRALVMQLCDLELRCVCGAALRVPERAYALYFDRTLPPYWWATRCRRCARIHAMSMTLETVGVEPWVVTMYWKDHLCG